MLPDAVAIEVDPGVQPGPAGGVLNIDRHTGVELAYRDRAQRHAVFGQGHRAAQGSSGKPPKERGERMHGNLPKKVREPGP